MHISNQWIRLFSISPTNENKKTIRSNFYSKEEIIVSLTTWSARINNLPVVLNSILEQTVKADKIIVNLAYNEYIPHDVFVFLESNGIEVFYTDDTKVYNKFIPTLKRYPKACVINIDDDLIYPPTLIEDFISVHKQCPNNPVCGNHAFLFGRYCHCGEASLTKLEYFGSYINEIDAELMASCSSSDIVFTYLATLAGHPYIPSRGFYGSDYQPQYNAKSPYSENVIGNRGIENTYEYLRSRFGEMPPFTSFFTQNDYISDAIESILKRRETELCQIKSSRTYKIAQSLSIIANKVFMIFR